MSTGRSRCVIVAHGRYVRHAVLERAESDAAALGAVLEARHGFATTILAGLERGPLLDRMDEELGSQGLEDGNLILVWIGHARVGADATLRLIGISRGEDVQVATAADLGEWAARTGARQALVVMDTCFSGAGILEATRLAEAIQGGRASPGRLWFGVLAASLRDEPSRSGALVRELTRVLAEGPRTADFRWNASRPFICGPDLLQAVCADWSEPRQQPISVSIGRAWDLVMNPCPGTGRGDLPEDHLLRAARGGSGVESYFTGREEAVRRTVAWICRGKPGLLVITGPPGCGKSAVAGRVASLSAAAERDRILAREVVAADLDPGEGSVDAQVQLRGMTVDAASEVLAVGLGLEGGTGPFGVLGEARRRRKAGDPLVVVMDGLDEAQSFREEMAEALIQPLAREALVLVSTRDVPTEAGTLLERLGPAAEVIDLGVDAEGSRRDVRAYVVRRLTGVSPVMDSERVAEEIAGGNGREAPAFLLARLVTSQLRESPVDTASEGWELTLSTSVESALERDLQSVVLTVAGRANPGAARELIGALVHACGGGFPADDVWPAVATAVSRSGTVYTREEVFRLIAALGRHLVAGREGNQPVYRVAHQRLVDYLRRDSATVSPGADGRKVEGLVAETILRLYEGWLDGGLAPREPGYLWRHAWRHLAVAGKEGLTGMRRLVARDRKAFLGDLTLALQWVALEAWRVGRVEEATAWVEEAVTALRELNESLRLAMALFLLAQFRTSAGDDAGAAQAAEEAQKKADAAGDQPGARRVLAQALIARAISHFRRGESRGSRWMAEKAVSLLESPSGGEEADTWASLSLACHLAGQACWGMDDLESAERWSRRAVEVVEAQVRGREGEDQQGLAALIEALGGWALIQYMKGARRLGPTGEAKTGEGGERAGEPVETSAGERVWALHRQWGPQRTIVDLATAKGLLLLLQGWILNAACGVAIRDRESVDNVLASILELVEPFAERMCDAAVLKAGGLQFRARFRPAASVEEAVSDWAAAEALLRRYSDVMPAAAADLGRLLHQRNQWMRAVRGQGGAEESAQRLAWQKEAVALLRSAKRSNDRAMLGHALANLAELSGDLEIPLRREAIEVWRGVVGVMPEVLMPLLGALCDQAGRLCDLAFVEAAELATEAIERAQGVAGPLRGLYLGLAETNLAAARMNLGYLRESRAVLTRAIAHLEPFEAVPALKHVLAVTCTNLAVVAVEDGDPETGLSMARRAVQGLENEVASAPGENDRLRANLALGKALRATGAEAEGAAIVETTIEELCRSAREQVDRVGLLAVSLNRVAPELWEAALERLEGVPDAHRWLRLQRWQPRERVGEVVRLLIEELRGRSPVESGMVRSIARTQRARMPEAFDEAWLARAGEVPGWLSMSPEIPHEVQAWLRTGTWVLSKSFLQNHPHLLDLATEWGLEELGMAGWDPEDLDRHRGLIETARAVGVEAAYAPYLLAGEVSDWSQSDDPEQHLAQHPELLRPEIAALLEERILAGDTGCGLLLAVLDLARREESSLAFRIGDEPEAYEEPLRAAWRCGDALRLMAMATLIRMNTRDRRLRMKAAAAFEVGRLLGASSGVGRGALDLRALGETAEDREAMIAVMGDAMEHHPRIACELSRVIVGLQR